MRDDIMGGILATAVAAPVVVVCGGGGGAFLAVALGAVGGLAAASGPLGYLALPGLAAVAVLVLRARRRRRCKTDNPQRTRSWTTAASPNKH